MTSFFKLLSLWLVMHCILELWDKMNPFSLKLLLSGYWITTRKEKKLRQTPLPGSFHKDYCVTCCYSNKTSIREQTVSKVISASNRQSSGTSHWSKQAKSPAGSLGVSEATPWVVFKLCLFSLNFTYNYDVNIWVCGVVEREKYWKRKQEMTKEERWEIILNIKITY